MSSPEASFLADAASRRAWLAPGLLLVGALVLVRSAVLVDLAVAGRFVDPDIARWAAGAQLSATLVQSIVLGLAAAAVLFLGTGIPSTRGIAACFCIALVFWSMAGVDAAITYNTSRYIDLRAPDGPRPAISTPSLLALAAVVAVVAVWLVARFLRARPRLLGLAGSWPVLGVAGALGIAAPAWVVWQRANSAPGMSVREVVCELALADERLEATERDAEHPPGLGILTPLVHSEIDGADKPALVMPPPCTVEFVVQPEEREVRLHGAAGVDVATAAKVPAEGKLRVRFEVLVDGAPRFDEIVEVRHPDRAFAPGPEGEAAARAHAWRHFGAGQGIPLESGQRVTLRTSLPDLAGDERARGLKLGFGGLALERERERERELATPDEPNLVLIVMDTLRADRCSTYGYARRTTPHLDALAARGLRFEQAYSTSSWTWPSTASLLTGLLPDEHGVVSNESSTLFQGYETLAEALQERGYTTAAITCNNLIADERLFDQGFERFDDDPRPRKTMDVIGEVRATISSISEARFFLYLHLMDPHTPHEPLESEIARLGIGAKPADYPDQRVGERFVDGMDEYARRLNKAASNGGPEFVIPSEHIAWMNDAYDASVATGDYWLGVILGELEDLGLADTTVMAFTSDHGEELLDHGGLAHGHTLHRELLHVPLVLAGPGIPAGARVGTPVSNRHLGPTLAMLGGTRLERVADAQNLLAENGLGGPLLASTEKGVWNGARPQRLDALRADGFVLHENTAADERRLYDASIDPTEQVDVAGGAANEERVVELSRALERWLGEQRARRYGSAAGMGAAARSALEGIGYIDGGDDADATIDCPSCGAPVRRSAGACPECGEDLR